MLSRLEVIGIGVYGATYIVFVYLSIIGYYLMQMDGIRSGQRSLNSVIGLGVLFHLGVATLASLGLYLVSAFYRSTTTSFNPKEMAAMIFAIDWQHLDMNSIINVYDVSTSHAILLLKGSMMLFNFLVLGAIAGFAIGLFLYTYGFVHKQSENGAIWQAVSSAFVKQGIVIFAVIAHSWIASAYTKGLVDSAEEKIQPVIVPPLKPMPAELRQRLVWTVIQH